MFPIYYIGKRTLFDILRTGVFWSATALCCFICFAMLYWGWHQVRFETETSRRHEHRRDWAQEDQVQDNQDFQNQVDNEDLQNSEDQAPPPERQDMEMGDPFNQISPRVFIVWSTYGITIAFANLLAIFMMMGVLSRDLENRRIDILLARPVSRGQIYFGKLLGGWVSVIIFMALVLGMTYLSMIVGGMGIQPKYIKAVGIGLLSPLLIASMTLFLSIWMKGMLAGFLSIIAVIGSGAMGIFMTDLLGIKVLKLDTAVLIIHKIFPPLNVIGDYASRFVEKDLSMRFVKEMSDMVFQPTPGYTRNFGMWGFISL